METISEAVRAVAARAATTQPFTTNQQVPVPEWYAAVRKAAGAQEITDRAQLEAVSATAVSSLAKQLGCRYSRERSKLDKFEVYHKSQDEAIAKAKSFITAMPDVIAEGRGLLLYGSVGTGKDHILAAALYAVASAGIPVSWVSGQEVFGRIRDTMDTGQKESSVIAEWTKPFVLGLSDPIPPIGKVSEWNTMQLYRILDKRYRERKCTWVTMNANDEADADAKLSAPVFDRIQDNTEMIRCFWPSYRERQRRK